MVKTHFILIIIIFEREIIIVCETGTCKGCEGFQRAGLCVRADWRVCEFVLEDVCQPVPLSTSL